MQLLTSMLHILWAPLIQYNSTRTPCFLKLYNSTTTTLPVEDQCSIPQPLLSKAAPRFLSVHGSQQSLHTASTFVAHFFSLFAEVP